jgi:hypothetical protein
MSPYGVLQFQIAKSMNNLHSSLYSFVYLNFVIQFLSIVLLCTLKKPINLLALYIGTLNRINLGLFRFL